MDLIYRGRVLIEDLALGHCTIHRASGSKAAKWWQLWFFVLRETDDKPATFCVPVNPGGSYVERGPGGRTWGFTKTAEGIWQVSPSIHVHLNGDASLASVAAVGSSSLWHQTPRVVAVPPYEPWSFGGAS